MREIVLPTFGMAILSLLTSPSHSVELKCLVEAQAYVGEQSVEVYSNLEVCVTKNMKDSPLIGPKFGKPLVSVFNFDEKALTEAVAAYANIAGDDKQLVFQVVGDDKVSVFIKPTGDFSYKSVGQYPLAEALGQ